MNGFQRTRLWRETLHPQPEDPDERARTHLRTEYLKLRDNAATLAAEIPKSLPWYTDHSISHLDGLWETADVIVGDTWTPTPAEAFVLGAAFLLHDLGMGLAAYPRGADELRESPHWQDQVVIAYHRCHGEFPEQQEIDAPSPEVLRFAEELALRELHAAQAERLLLLSWNLPDGSSVHLLDDETLRTRLGRLIGRIAHSHWWDISILPREFGDIVGALSLPAYAPTDWTIDPLRVACLVRLADASHLDARRAPSFLRAIRQPQGESDLHWSFQTHLERVRRDPGSDRLYYSSAQPFKPDEAAAWWVGIDLLRRVDAELRSVDSLLSDVGRPRFAAKAVFGVEDPERLRRSLPTDDWIPASAELRVTDVSDLVSRIGGEQLYGHNVSVGLRELVQNASDAILARRRLDPYSAPGHVTVALKRDSSSESDNVSWVLTVTDNGVGMSKEVLTGTLLDFGNSLWMSDEAREQLPGLLASGFRSIGRFGIGFFATFMLGPCVTVVSNRFDAAAHDTSVLEFPAGLKGRPLLREADPQRWLIHGGTSVAVKLAAGPYDVDGLLEDHSLEELCLKLFPALPVDLHVELDGIDRHLVIEGDDWKRLPALELLRRLSISDYIPDYISADPQYEVLLDRIGSAIREIKDESGDLIGRIALVPGQAGLLEYGIYVGLDGAIVTTGGIACSEVPNFAGVLVGEPSKASRDEALPRATSDVLAPWATEQLNLIRERGIDPMSLFELAPKLHHIGLDPSDLPIALAGDGFLTGSEAVDTLVDWPEVHLCDAEEFGLILMADDSPGVHDYLTYRSFVVDAPGVLLVNMWDHPLSLRGTQWRLTDRRDAKYREEMDARERWSPGEWWYHTSASLGGWLIKQLAERWEVDVRTILAHVVFSEDGTRPLMTRINSALSPERHFGRAVRLIRPVAGAPCPS